MLFVLIVLVAVLCAVSLYALDVISAYTAFVGRSFGLDAPPAAVPPVVAPAATPAPSKPASAGSTYVAPIASCGAAIDCDAASKLALAHYSASPGAQPGAQITRVASAADHNACNYAFTIPGTMKTVHVNVLGHSADVAVPFPQEERRFVFARDPVTCAPTTVDVMGDAGSGFMVENAVAGTLSLGGMCAVPQGGKTSDGGPRGAPAMRRLRAGAALGVRPHDRADTPARGQVVLSGRGGGEQGERGEDPAVGVQRYARPEVELRRAEGRGAERDQTRLLPGSAGWEQCEGDAPRDVGLQRLRRRTALRDDPLPVSTSYPSLRRRDELHGPADGAVFRG